MKALGIISTAALFLFFGATVSTYAQDEHHDQDPKPEKQQDAKPAQHEEQTKPAQDEKQTKPVKPEDQAKTEKQDQPAKQDAQPKPAKDEKPAKAVKQQEQAKTEKPAQENKQTAREGDAKSAPQHAQRTASEQKKQNAVPALRLSVSGEGRIPDARFQANFGQGHTFRIGSPRIVDGYSRFQYGGFWFGFVQPWPDGWYYTDNVYVDYVDGGYYLYNPYYPGVRMSICVVL
jgi:outer membrane biosynthesis protein TonB